MGEAFSISTITLTSRKPAASSLWSAITLCVDGSSAPYGSRCLATEPPSAPAMTKKIAARITVRLPCRSASDASELNITYLLSAPTRAPAVCFSRSSAALSNHSAVHSLISMP